jgi:hypothetical protein
MEEPGALERARDLVERLAPPWSTEGIACSSPIRLAVPRARARAEARDGGAIRRRR